MKRASASEAIVVNCSSDFLFQTLLCCFHLCLVGSLYVLLGTPGDIFGCVISFNVNGISNSAERRQILTKMKRENAQIVLLQETHFTPLEHGKLKRMGFSRVYYSSYESGHRRGVATLISQQIPFEQVSVTSDKEGRDVVASGKIHYVIITICNIFAPPESNFAFHRNIFDLMIEGTGVIVCGGNFNILLNPKQDSSENPVITRLGN